MPQSNFSCKIAYLCKISASSYHFIGNGKFRNGKLRENSNIQMSLLRNTGKRTCFAYITVPEHVVRELLKLHGIEFNGRKLVIEKAKTPPKKTTGKNKQAFVQTHSPAVDFEMKIFETVPRIQRITGSYSDAVLPKKGAVALFQTEYPA